MLMLCYLIDIFPLMSSELLGLVCECSYIDQFGLPCLGLNLEIINQSSQIISSVELLQFHQRRFSLPQATKMQTFVVFF